MLMECSCRVIGASLCLCLSGLCVEVGGWLDRGRQAERWWWWERVAVGWMGHVAWLCAGFGGVCLLCSLVPSFCSFACLESVGRSVGRRSVLYSPLC
jgi:hypothetical protein